MPDSSEITLEELEIDLLLDAVARHYGYDFRNYARASLRRRLAGFRQQQGVASYSELIPIVLHDSEQFTAIIEALSVTVTEMFRDPFVYSMIRKELLPRLATFPHFNIWHAGCATGDEVYSMAILLKEEGLYDRATIYATDINGSSLHAAKEGIYSLEQIRTNTLNYQKAGGRRSFSDYYHANYKNSIIRNDLKRNIVFSTYNLVSDRVFNEMHLLMCCNVLIYFDEKLQGRVFKLIDSSLVRNGFLCLGTKESMLYSGVSGSYEAVGSTEKIFRKVKS